MARFLVFFLVVTTILGVAFGFVGLRIIPPAKLPPPWHLIAWASWMAGALLIPGAFSLRLLGVEGWVADALNWLAYLVMGIFALLFTLVVARDFLWWGARGIDALLALFGDDPPRLLPADPARRRALLHTTNLALLGLAGAGAAVGYVEARRRARVTRVDIPLRDLPEALVGFTVAQISDIHVGPTIKRGYLEAIVEAVNALDADLVAVTGDLVDGSVAELHSHVAPLGQLKATHGAYFVTGNHEYYSGAEEWVAHVRKLGLTALLNEHHVVEHAGHAILVAGVTDYNAGSVLRHHHTDPERAVQNAPDCAVNVLLAHQPRSLHKAREVAVGPANKPFHLQLSGHTHGGQFIPWNLFVRLQQPLTAGLHAVETTFAEAAEKMWVYVNRGTGYWGPPVRLGVPSEITLLTLRRA